MGSTWLTKNSHRNLTPIEDRRSGKSGLEEANLCYGKEQIEVAPQPCSTKILYKQNCIIE